MHRGDRDQVGRVDLDADLLADLPERGREDGLVLLDVAGGHRPVAVHVAGIGPEQQQDLVAAPKHDVRRGNHLEPIHPATLDATPDKVGEGGWLA